MASAPETASEPVRKDRVGGYRLKLMVVMMLMVVAVSGAGLYLAERGVAESVTSGLQREFQTELRALHGIQEIRQATFAEVCRALVRKPRIHAALEDNALDLLYAIAKDEMRDVMSPSPSGGMNSAGGLEAVFYRFLDLNGTVISPRNAPDPGPLTPEEEQQLSLKGLPRGHQIGYLLRHSSTGAEEVAEVIATPIISTETGEAIAALAIGFKPSDPAALRPVRGVRRGIWLQQRLHLTDVSDTAKSELGAALAGATRSTTASEEPARIEVDGVAHLVFHKPLNPGSTFPPAEEVCLYPLGELLARQRQLRWSFLGSGGLVLLGGLVASGFFSARLSAPVEQLAVDSEENRARRAVAEAELVLTHEGLQRAIRFSADASHQLKTPVAVLRSGLEELLSRDSLSPDGRREIDELIHQTYRLSSVIEDLLLLSRVDAGRLQLHFGPVNLSRLLEAGLDDLETLPDGTEYAVEAQVAPDLTIEGESRYTSIILQNLLENARKYNEPGGRIRIVALSEDTRVRVRVGNTGRTIPSELRERIFERFHRGSIAENVPGHGLGLNLARELTRLHGGELRLVQSEAGWTEFEASFKRILRPESGRVMA